MSRYKVDRKQVTSQGTQSFIRALARSRYKALQICHEGRSKSKNHDKQLTHIVRVSVSDFIFCICLQSCYLVNNHGIVYLQALLKALVVHQPERLLNVLAKML